MDEKVAYWVDIAEYDLVTARAMLDTGRYLYVGFMCHQVIEKMLKACYVAARAETPPHTHNLGRLAAESCIDEHTDEEQRGLLDLLEPLNLEARYPTSKDDFSRTMSRGFCETLIKRTEDLYTWTKRRLSSV